jgi:hypothetical protein
VSNRRKLRGSDWSEASRVLREAVRGNEDEIHAQLDAATPGFADQLQAASAEGAEFSDEVRRRAKEKLGSQYLEADHSKLPGQMSDQVFGLYIRVVTEMASGARRGCRHVSLKTPKPSVAPVYADWIRCLSCYMSQPHDVPLTEREEHTCDLCGSYQPGQNMDAFFPQIGPVMLIIGACPACRAKVHP